MTDPVVTKELDLTYAEAAELGFRCTPAGRLQESEAIYRTLIAVIQAIRTSSTLWAC